jgi:S1-C subfamily serine protease
MKISKAPGNRALPHGLAISFCLGVAVGVLLTRHQRDLAAPAPAAESANPRINVAGSEGPPASRVRKTGAARVRPSATQGAVPLARTLPTRTIAERARAITALIRDGSVYGSGVLIDPRGYVLTCRHVVEKANTFEVSFADGEPMTAKLVDEDRALDLAVLSLDEGRQARAHLASSSFVRPGDAVFAMGAPRKMAHSFAQGVISFEARLIEGIYYLQSDLPINEGNSGGPLLNGEGALIGLVSFILRDAQGLSFALPIDYAYRRFRHYFSEPLDVREFERRRPPPPASAP